MKIIENIPVFLKDLPTTIRGFTCLGVDYSPCIVINARLSKEQQRKTYRHEINHIRNGDMDNENYMEYCKKT